jgi:hypothetical protein
VTDRHIKNNTESGESTSVRNTCGILICLSKDSSHEARKQGERRRSGNRERAKEEEKYRFMMPEGMN